MNPRNRKRSHFLAVLSLAALCLSAAQVQARPYRGGIAWSILLCKFSDSPTPPNSVGYYTNMTLGTGTQGLQDYVRSISNGLADLSGSVIKGWYTESHTLAYEQGLSSRWQRVQDCIDTAAASTTDHYVVPAGNRVYVITSPGVDLAGWENTGAIGGDGVALPEIAHEFGHGIGMNHSWSNDITWRDVSWAGPGEYDNPWDLMSAANVYVDPTMAFGGGPPDLDAHHLDEMGWIPKSRILTLGVDGILSRTVTLAALTHSSASGSLLVRIPFDPADRFHYYTVEYRTPDSWDAGIPAAIVMINEVKNNGSYYQTTLQRELGTFAGTGNGPPVQSLNANGVTISVTATSGDHATITVSTTFALPCAPGFVPRDASSIDRVCVTAATRTQTAADNAAAGSRHVASSTNCIPGYVWREAYPGDVVCVTLATRTQAQTDNANAYNHVNESLVTYGPNTCQNGYVWRDGDDSDYVCVTPLTRTQTAADNAAAGSRHVAGSANCVAGYGWRLAWPNDHVCVTAATRTQVSNDNAQATARLQQLFAAIPPPSHFFSLIGTAYAVEPPKSEAETPPPVSEAVLRVRLAKMGFTQVQKLVRTSTDWEATVSKNGATQVLHLDPQMGTVIGARK